MALRREDLTPDQLEIQKSLDESWEHAQHDLADPEFRSRIEESLRRIDTNPPAPRLTRDEFLAQTEPVDH